MGMNDSFDKTSKILQEIKEIIDRIGNEPEVFSQIDTDLALEKTRKLYDILLNFHTEEGKKTKLPFREKTEEMQVTESTKEKVKPLPESPPAEEPSNEGMLFGNEEERKESVKEKVDIPVENPSLNLFSISTENTSGGKKSVVDKISESHNEKSIGDAFRKDKIKSLKQAIGINEKFFFINELFDGNMKEYAIAIDALDAIVSLDETLNALEGYIHSFDWNNDSDAVVLLKEFIERKFK